jgi:hypothetical protein
LVISDWWAGLPEQAKWGDPYLRPFVVLFGVVCAFRFRQAFGATGSASAKPMARRVPPSPSLRRDKFLWPLPLFFAAFAIFAVNSSAVCLSFLCVFV